MTRWREQERGSFEAMPPELVAVDLDSSPELKLERAEWLEANGLTLVDYLSWKRARSPAAKVRPAARRRWLTLAQRRELDREREAEEEFRW